MENTTYISISRQIAMRHRMDVIANNIANANTTGYKGEHMVFEEYLRPTDSGQRLSLVQDVATVRDVTEGNKIPTASDLDVALVGKGYFAVGSEIGERYTRNGAFTLNPDGELTNGQGAPILGQNDRPIIISGGGPVTISKDGTVSDGKGIVGKLKVVTFDDEQAMVKLSGNLYDADGQEPREAESYEVRQGMLEGSNINPIIELTRLLDASRSNSSVAKIAKEEHERMMKAIRLLGSTTGI